MHQACINEKSLLFRRFSPKKVPNNEDTGTTITRRMK